jgi:rhodanese-related sulfurtransferase
VRIYSKFRKSSAQLLLSLFTICSSQLLILPAKAQTESLPQEISPEGVQALSASDAPFFLIDADRENTKLEAQSSRVRPIYYVTTLSTRPAQNRVVQDRLIQNANSDGVNQLSQRLSGTPMDWQRLGLKIDLSRLQERPQLVSPKQLSEAIKDDVDLQIVDFRPLPPKPEATPFPKALRIMPHLLAANLAVLSKQRWTVLIDDGNRVSQPLAEKLLQQGYLLTSILDGGYPAWVAATGK